MEEMADESSRYPWQDYDLGFGAELMRELLDETAVLSSTVAGAGSADHSSSSSKGVEEGEERGKGPAARRRESMVNRLILTVYYGPTLSDIESALCFPGTGAGGLQVDGCKYYGSSRPVVFSPEKLLSMMENKYTMKIKACGNRGLANDGYKWRKYGQKNIKNSPNPRCTI